MIWRNYLKVFFRIFVLTCICLFFATFLKKLYRILLYRRRNFDSSPNPPYPYIHIVIFFREVKIFNNLFLAIHLSDVDDVRPVLQYYNQFDDPTAEFRRRVQMIADEVCTKKNIFSKTTLKSSQSHN